jgi:hypothetical protein
MLISRFIRPSVGADLSGTPPIYRPLMDTQNYLYIKVNPHECVPPVLVVRFV